ncbi:MAG: hypothetical protein IRY85_03645 [Micromonosporaceae bacterium]|nr:hypothetical protein [Micromonosporaceae bacterium]
MTPIWRYPTTISTNLPDWHADKLILFRHGNRVSYAVVVETQLGRENSERRRWPQYQTIVHGRHGCPTIVMVVCADDATTRWAGTPIELDNHGSVIRPVAVGPRQMPRVTDPDRARDLPLLAALSLIGHPGDPQVRTAAVAAALALFEDSPIKARAHHDFMVKRLKGRERELWENQVLTTGGYRYESKVFRDLEARSLAKGREEGRAEGLAEGEVKAGAKYLLRVLDRRAIPMTDDQRSRIMACTDPAILDRWLDRALDATTIDDVLTD